MINPKKENAVKTKVKKKGKKNENDLPGFLLIVPVPRGS